MKVVYIYRANILVLDGNAVKHTSNIYGRYADKEYIIKYGEDVKQQRGAHNCFESQQDKANRGRSLSMKYRWMCQGRQYSKAEKQEIREHIDEYNKKCEKLAETKQNKRYLENIKDVGIFNQNVFQGEE